MSSSGKAGNGRLNNRKRLFRRRENDAWQEGDLTGRPSGGDGRSARAQTPSKGNNPNNRKDRGERLSYYERPKWIPPKTSTDPLPVPECPWCGKPIRDMSSAIADKDTGSPVHFDCVTARIAFGERLERGDSIAYIGGGRFGIIGLGGLSHRSLPLDKEETHERSSFPANRGFIIKKIIEWENKEKRAEWRSVICDHYSVT